MAALPGSRQLLPAWCALSRRLVIVEPGASIGKGVAFGGHCPLHLLNLRTRDLSIRAGQPGDFLNWVFREFDQGENYTGLHDGLAHAFPRQLFAEYVRQRFFETVERRNDVEVRILNQTAISCHAKSGRYQIVLTEADPVVADIAILATAYGLFPSAASTVPHCRRTG